MTDNKASRVVLQCPHCGFKSVEKLGRAPGPKRLVCAACSREILSRGACCVYCDYGRPGCGSQPD